MSSSGKSYTASKKSLSGAMKSSSLGPFLHCDGTAQSDTADSSLYYSENMWRDYNSRDLEIIETIPGFRRLTRQSLGGEIFGMRSYNNPVSGKRDFVCHAGNRIYIFANSDFDSEPFIYEGVRAEKSAVAAAGGRLWVFDGENPIRLTPSAEGYEVSDTSEAYAPITYKNSEEYEKRNLLTDKIREIYTPSAAQGHPPCRTLTYSALADGTLEVTGITTLDQSIYIPPAVTIRGESCIVSAIAAGAFKNNTGLRSVIIGGGISVGAGAFLGCTSLELLIFEPQSGERPVVIGAEAFLGSPVKTLFLTDFITNDSTGVLSIGQNAFGCGRGGGIEDFSGQIIYSDAVDRFAAIDGLANLCREDYEYVSFSETVEGRLGPRFYLIPMYTRCVSVEGAVTADADVGVALDLGAVYRDADATEPNQTIRYVIIRAPSWQQLDGVPIELFGTASQKALTTSYGSEENGAALRHCRLCAEFDGRLFLSGNKGLPNTVFYSGYCRTGGGAAVSQPFYFPEDCFFDDGVSDERVCGMLSFPGELYVFKDGGEIYVHRATQTHEYTVAQGCCERGSLGDIRAFCGSPVFVSAFGVERLVKGTNGEYRAVHLSASCPEIDTETGLGRAADITVFDNYLVLTSNGKMYLADGSTATDAAGIPGWYRLTDIGIYEGQSEGYIPTDFVLRLERINETDAAKSETLIIDPKKYSPNTTDSPYAKTEYFAYINGDFHSAYINAAEEGGEGKQPTLENITAEVYFSDLYIKQDGEYLPLMLCQNMSFAFFEPDKCCFAARANAKFGGIFDPAVTAQGLDGKLYFGTRGGYVCIFNTDKRGKAVYIYDKSTKNRYVCRDGRYYLLSEADGTYCGGGDHKSSGIFTSLLYSDGVGGREGMTEDEKSREAAVFYDGAEDKCYLLCDSYIQPSEDRIDPYYYNFDGRAIYCCAVTQKDICGNPHIAKSTVRGSVILCCPDFFCGSMRVRCRTDREPFFTVKEMRSGKSDMERLDFSAFSFSDREEGRLYCIIPEKCRRYMWKQYHFSAYDINSPIGIHSINYRYLPGKYKC